MAQITNEGQPFAEFDFDLGKAVTAQLVEAFDGIPIGRLNEEWLRQLDDRPAVYQSFLKAKLVYIGKSKHGLSGRLKRHCRALLGRKNINPQEVGFKCLYIHPNWVPYTHEETLLAHYEASRE